MLGSQQTSQLTYPAPPFLAFFAYLDDMTQAFNFKPSATSSPADVFAVPDLWRSSKWLFSDSEDNINQPLIKRPIIDTSVPCSPFFKLPQINPGVIIETPPLLHLNSADASGLADKAPATSDSSTPPTAEAVDSAFTADDDIWLAASQPASKRPEYQSWAAFTSLEDDPCAPEALLITEAPSEVYDAVLAEAASDQAPERVADTSIYMSCLLSALLGRESLFFVWNDDKTAIISTIKNLRVSGYSRHVLGRLESLCLNCGILFHRLKSFVQSTYSKTSSRCRVALGSAIDTVLSVVESDIALYKQPQSLLQLLVLVNKVHLVFAQFYELVSRLAAKHPDEVILQTVFQHAQVSEYNPAPLHDAMRVLLQRVSQPWIDFIEEWVGLKHEDGMPMSKDDVGASKHFVKVESEIFVDDFGEEVEEIDFRLDRAKMPDFVPKDMADSIFEAGKNIRFIRSEHSEHPLANLATVSKSNPPESVWRYDWDAILDLEKRALEYEASLINAINEARTQQRKAPASYTALNDGHGLLGSLALSSSLGATAPDLAFANSTWGLQIYGFDETDISSHLQVSMNELGEPLPEVIQRDALADAIRDCLQGHQQEESQPQASSSQLQSTTKERIPNNNAHLVSPHWSLLPLLSFNPLTSAHGKVVNRESLKLLFSHHDLLGHLRLQKDFYLFGNGRFASRLTHALFDPQLETAERTAGVAAQGGIMGLRLTSRDKWPPASSELRLALMGILAESYASESSVSLGSTSTSAHNANISGNLPGDLSFAVRTMSEADIQKCMNPDALEAMDFLRLSYKAPQALAPIFTPLIMMQYDRIFKQMLRVARLLYVVDSLSREAISLRSLRPQATVALRFCYEAHHFVYTVANHFVDCGITLTWRAFETWLASVQLDLTTQSKSPSASSPPFAPHSHLRTHSPERLRVCHSMILDRMLISLFLRKRQQPVSQLLNDIFGLVLQFDKLARVSSVHDNEDQMTTLYAAFRAKIELFISVCRGLTEKSDITVRYESREKADEVRAELGEALDGNTVAMLLMKLDIAGFYLKGQDF
ncbi:Spc97 / Spc98 family protein [Ceratocystis lukuohia]|uniref:Spindle pole body component n=1 Tax=Ceratocystis lukuohia TaxID=2019550 RepID=A0ABR4MMX4_9PEZI